MEINRWPKRSYYPWHVCTPSRWAIEDCTDLDIHSVHLCVDGNLWINLLTLVLVALNRKLSIPGK